MEALFVVGQARELAEMCLYRRNHGLLDKG